MQKRCVVLGGGGFIGNALVTRLKQQGCAVAAADLKFPEFGKSQADEFYKLDLSDDDGIQLMLTRFRNTDEVYQLAADMGGAGYIFSGDHDADVMSNSALINLHAARMCVKHKVPKIFFSSSACMYPAHIQTDVANPGLKESDAYPAAPDSEYGWEKLFSERLYLAFARNYKLDVRIARFHNIFGPEGTWKGGKEKAPAAICRKIAEAEPGGTIEIWGDGEQTRSFLYIQECLDGIQALMASDCTEPVNIGSDESVSINQLVQMVTRIAGKHVMIEHVKGPLGVRGRSSDNAFVKERIGWSPKDRLFNGLCPTYHWIHEQIHGSA
jgi:nucleoside-diphosphate-sugar epimerase